MPNPTSASSSSSVSKESSLAPRIYSWLGLLLHAVLLVLPILSSNILHDSDKIWTQQAVMIADPTTTVNNNWTTVEFGLRAFRVVQEDENDTIEYNDTTIFLDNSLDDITFSYQQQEAFGSSYRAAHILFHVWNALQWLSVVLPLLVYGWNRLSLHRQQKQKQPSSSNENSNVASHYRFAWQLARMYVDVYLPLLMVLTASMVVPFFLLKESNLCGPSYIQLGFTAEQDDEDDGASRDEDDDVDFVGSFAIVHSDMSASCSMGRTGKWFLVSQVATVLLSAVHIVWMRRCAYYLELQYQLSQVISGHESSEMEKPVDEDDDQATVVTQVYDGIGV
jgi:hypothetical protein